MTHNNDTTTRPTIAEWLARVQPPTDGHGTADTVAGLLAEHERIVREQVAQDIEAQRATVPSDYGAGDPWTTGILDGYNKSVEIARGAR